MLKTLKALFEDQIAQYVSADDPRDALPLAVAALLLEISRADQDVDDAERHAVCEAVARICDTSADELEALVERESTRPYYEYNNVYLPPDMLSNQAALVPSPLAKEPNEPLVQVYFQYRDDSLTSPTIAEAPVENAEDADQKVADAEDGEEDEPDPTTEKTMQQLKAIEPDPRVLRELLRAERGVRA